MVTNVLMLLFSLGFILFVCAVFTNAIEWFGKRLNLSQGVVGSIFAAIGTALPETIIPIIAISFSAGAQAHEVGIGAIAGAPFMLATLGFFVSGAAIVIYAAMGKRSTKMNLDADVFARDLTFFVVIYGIAVLTTFVHNIMPLRIAISVILVLGYVLYVKRTFSAGCEEGCEHNLDPLYLHRYLRVKTNLFWIIVQLVLALLGIVFGAHLFVKYVENVSLAIGIAPLILSIIITPIATELPEKLNSVIWVGQKKDTLALGNMSGAMVFQSCFPVVFGILFTPWNLKGATMVSAILAFAAALLNLVWIKTRKTANPFVLMTGGLFYLIFILYVFAF